MAVWSSFLGHLLLFLVTVLPCQAHGKNYSTVLGQEGENSQSTSTNCDLSQGSWVYDDSYQLYDGSNCPFIAPALNCQKNGRPDEMYLKYRWKPDGCELTRFDGEDFLQRNRGKKIMFVGDSLSSNQWQSLACMLHSAVTNSNYTFAQTVARSSLSFPEYGVSIIFLKNGFLVDLVIEKIGRILKLDSISRSNQWEGVDVLVFNSYHWWMHSGRLQTWDYYQVGDKITKDMDRMEAYKIALTTWANWVDSNIDPTKTTVFFQGISAVHYLGKDWNEPNARNCIGQTQPIEGSNYLGNKSPGESIVKSVVANMRKPVYLLDITMLTQLRKDGHPSKYANGRGTDCSHWCLAGVPDTWNQLFNTILLQK